MSIMPEPAQTAEAAARQRAQRLEAAAELLRHHADEWARLDRTREHLIRASYEAGMSEERIAELLGISRTPVRRYLNRPDERARAR